MARLLSLLLLALVMNSCSVGRMMVPQSDIEAYDVGSEASELRILVAARDSEFKVDVAGRVGTALAQDDVYVKFVGVDQLKDEVSASWSAVIVMTACLAWGMDSATESFLEKNDGPNVVVLITSGEGDWTPDMEGRKFDAVTSASVMTNAGVVAEEILDKVRTIIARSGSGA